MTRTRCLTPEEVQHPDAEAAAHLEACPRCRALGASVQEFLAPADLPAAAELRDANAALDMLIDREFAVPSPARALARSPARPIRGRLRWWLWSVVPALGAAAVLVLLLNPYRGGSGVLRGGKASPLVVRAAETRADGSVLLRWQRVPAATTYRVRLFDSDLKRLPERSADRDTFLVLPAGQTAAFCRVEAYSGSMRIAESEAQWVGRR